MKTNTKPSSPELSRRAFLGKAVKGATLTALFAGLPKNARRESSGEDGFVFVFMDDLILVFGSYFYGTGK